jgi:hypothetical protein
MRAGALSCAQGRGRNPAAHSAFLHEGRCWLTNQGRRWLNLIKTISVGIVPTGVVERKKVISSSYTQSSSAPAEAAAYGGLADAIGGIATVVLAILALAGVHREIMLPIAVIVFGAALLIQGATMLSEYAGITFPAGSTGASSGSSESRQFVQPVSVGWLGSCSESWRCSASRLKS